MNYNDRVSYNYALVLQKLGKRDEAEQAFLDGIRANPRSTANLYGLSFLYFEQKKLQKAYSTAQQLVNIDPQEPSYQQLFNAIQAELNLKK